MAWSFVPLVPPEKPLALVVRFQDMRRALTIVAACCLVGCARSPDGESDEPACDLDESLFESPPAGEHYRMGLRGLVGVTDALAVEGAASAEIQGQAIDLPAFAEQAGERIPPFRWLVRSGP